MELVDRKRQLESEKARIATALAAECGAPAATPPVGLPLQGPPSAAAAVPPELSQEEVAGLCEGDVAEFNKVREQCITHQQAMADGMGKLYSMKQTLEEQRSKAQEATLAKKRKAQLAARDTQDDTMLDAGLAEFTLSGARASEPGVDLSTNTVVDADRWLVAVPKEAQEAADWVEAGGSASDAAKAVAKAMHDQNEEGAPAAAGAAAGSALGASGTSPSCG